MDNGEHAYQWDAWFDALQGVIERIPVAPSSAIMRPIPLIGKCADLWLISSFFSCLQAMPAMPGNFIPLMSGGPFHGPQYPGQ